MGGGQATYVTEIACPARLGACNGWQLRALEAVIRGSRPRVLQAAVELAQHAFPSAKCLPTPNQR